MILADMFAPNMVSLLGRMYQQGIKSVTNATVSEITEDGVIYKDAEGNEIKAPANTVVSAFGYKAYNPLEEALRSLCDDVHIVGSAVKAGDALVAIKEGYQAGLNI